MTTSQTPDADAARAFLADAEFTWHQRWELAPGVETPGVNNVASLFIVAALEADLTGLSVLDVGTTNGCAAFEAERRGAARVVAVDVCDEHQFGFARMRTFLGSRCEFVQANVYELAEALGGETFDLILFWGVLYHLRHPLLALDHVRAVAADRVSVESAICDAELPEGERGRALARFYRRDELGADASNWFAPTARLLGDWCESSGLRVEGATSWPEEDPTRGLVSCRVADGEPEAFVISSEWRLQVRSALSP